MDDFKLKMATKYADLISRDYKPKRYKDLPTIIEVKVRYLKETKNADWCQTVDDTEIITCWLCEGQKAFLEVDLVNESNTKVQTCGICDGVGKIRVIKGAC